MPDSGNPRAYTKHSGGIKDETCENIKCKHLKGYDEKRRLRRMPDIMSVCLQDFLHRRKSELREQQQIGRRPVLRR